MTKLREEHKKLKKKVKEERKIVTITTLWEVVKKTQKVIKNQITKYVTFCEATIHSRYMGDSKVYSGSCGSLNYNRTLLTSPFPVTQDSSKLRPR